MEMRDAQKEVFDFNEERDWNRGDIKDLYLNLVEEVGEAWNIVKWVDRDTQKKLLEDHKDEMEDFAGDVLYLLFKICSWSGVDAQKGFDRTMAEYRDRFPIEKVKGHHANRLAGGHDGKYD